MSDPDPIALGGDLLRGVGVIRRLIKLKNGGARMAFSHFEGLPAQRIGIPYIDALNNFREAANMRGNSGGARSDPAHTRYS